MTCIATLDGTIDIVTDWIGFLTGNVSSGDAEDLKEIKRVWDKAVKEISDGGDLKQMTCTRMSVLMLAAEADSKSRVLDGGTEQDLWMYEGLKRIHDKMTIIATHFGANEGNKPCCPLCVGC